MATSVNMSGIDLNLLVAFDALMEHRNVTRAARAVNLSQPAMSNALSRLRDLFADELLVRSPAGMRPTPRALEAHDAVRNVLAAIDGVFDTSHRFDPAKDARTFRVAMAEDPSLFLLPTLTRRIAGMAPRIEIDVVSTSILPGVELVQAGEVEACVAMTPKNLPKELRFTPVFRERLVAVVRQDHPVAKGAKTDAKIALKDFLAYPHVSLRPSVNAPRRVDDALAKIGKERVVAVTVPHFMVLLYLLPGTDMIACVAEKLARRVAPQIGLVLMEMPVRVPAYDVCLVWHRRFDQDRGHMWLRETIVEEGKLLSTGS
jgi:DNA-binding transcriptional LysR family regulator